MLESRQRQQLAGKPQAGSAVCQPAFGDIERGTYLFAIVYSIFNLYDLYDSD